MQPLSVKIAISTTEDIDNEYFNSNYNSTRIKINGN